MRFAALSYAYLLWLLPLLMFFYAYTLARKRQVLALTLLAADMLIRERRTSAGPGARSNNLEKVMINPG